jgi:hypothetical protein
VEAFFLRYHHLQLLLHFYKLPKIKRYSNLLEVLILAPQQAPKEFLEEEELDSVNKVLSKPQEALDQFSVALKYLL